MDNQNLMAASLAEAITSGEAWSPDFHLRFVERAAQGYSSETAASFYGGAGLESLSQHAQRTFKAPAPDDSGHPNGNIVCAKGECERIYISANVLRHILMCCEDDGFRQENKLDKDGKSGCVAEVDKYRTSIGKSCNDQRTYSCTTFVARFGVKIERAFIVGYLDLSGFQFKRPLSFTGCCFTHSVNLSNARLGAVTFGQLKLKESDPNFLKGKCEYLPCEFLHPITQDYNTGTRDDFRKAVKLRYQNGEIADGENRIKDGWDPYSDPRLENLPKDLWQPNCEMENSAGYMPTLMMIAQGVNAHGARFDGYVDLSGLIAQRADFESATFCSILDLRGAKVTLPDPNSETYFSDEVYGRPDLHNHKKGHEPPDSYYDFHNNDYIALDLSAADGKHFLMDECSIEGTLDLTDAEFDGWYLRKTTIAAHNRYRHKGEVVGRWRSITARGLKIRSNIWLTYDFAGLPPAEATRSMEDEESADCSEDANESASVSFFVRMFRWIRTLGGRHRPRLTESMVERHSDIRTPPKKTVFEGPVHLESCHVAENVELRGIHIELGLCPKVAGNIRKKLHDGGILDDWERRAVEALSLRNADIGGHLVLGRYELKPGQPSRKCASHKKKSQNKYAPHEHDFYCNGQIDLRSLKTGDDLRFEYCHVPNTWVREDKKDNKRNDKKDNPDEFQAIDLREAHIKRVLYFKEFNPHNSFGCIDLRHAYAELYSDTFDYTQNGWSRGNHFLNFLSHELAKPVTFIAGKIGLIMRWILFLPLLADIANSFQSFRRVKADGLRKLVVKVFSMLFYGAVGFATAAVFILHLLWPQLVPNISWLPSYGLIVFGFWFVALAGRFIGNRPKDSDGSESRGYPTLLYYCFGFVRGTPQWPENLKFILHNFRYGSFAHRKFITESHLLTEPTMGMALGREARVRWLRRQPDLWLETSFQPQPWVHCAKVLREMGYDRQSHIVQLKGEKQALKSGNVSLASKVFRWPLIFICGHGHEMWRLLVFAAIALFPALIFNNIAVSTNLMRPTNAEILVDGYYRHTRDTEKGGEWGTGEKPWQYVPHDYSSLRATPWTLRRLFAPPPMNGSNEWSPCNGQQIRRAVLESAGSPDAITACMPSHCSIAHATIDPDATEERATPDGSGKRYLCRPLPTIVFMDEATFRTRLKLDETKNRWNSCGNEEILKSIPDCYSKLFPDGIETKGTLLHFVAVPQTDYDKFLIRASKIRIYADVVGAAVDDSGYLQCIDGIAAYTCDAAKAAATFIINKIKPALPDRQDSGGPEPTDDKEPVVQQEGWLKRGFWNVWTNHAILDGGWLTGWNTIASLLIWGLLVIYGVFATGLLKRKE